MADRYEEVEAENGQLHMQVRRLKAENADLLAALREAVSILEEIEAQGVLLGSETEPPSLHTLGRISALFERCKNHPLGGE